MLILGGGPIGLAVLQALKARGCSQTIVSEISGQRKAFAREFGADHILDPTKDDVVTRVQELSNGRGGADVVFDCAGVEKGIVTGMQSLRARGTMMNIAVWEKNISMDVNILWRKERSWMGIATYTDGDFEEVLEALGTGMLYMTAVTSRPLTSLQES